MRTDFITGAFSALVLHLGFIYGGEYLFGVKKAVAAPPDMAGNIIDLREPEPEVPPIMIEEPSTTFEPLPPELMMATLREPTPSIHTLGILTQQVSPLKSRPPMIGGSMTHLIPITQNGGGPPAGIADGIIDVMKLDSTPIVRFQQQPDIPVAFKRKAEQGEIVAQLTVNQHGRVVEVKILEATHRELEKPSMEALYKWVFTPGMKDGQAVSFRMRQPLRFTIN